MGSACGVECNGEIIVGGTELKLYHPSSVPVVYNALNSLRASSSIIATPRRSDGRSKPTDTDSQFGAALFVAAQYVAAKLSDYGAVTGASFVGLDHRSRSLSGPNACTFRLRPREWQ